MSAKRRDKKNRILRQEPVTKQFSKSYTMTHSGHVVLIK